MKLSKVVCNIKPSILLGFNTILFLLFLSISNQ